MGRILTPSFWIQLFITTLFTMLMMYAIKKVNSMVNVPVVGDMIDAV